MRGMTGPDRASHFPAIERRYGQPMSYWHGLMAEIADRKYPEQIAYLRENHGFSQAHANALVMYSRGSLSTRRFNTLDEYFAGHDAAQVKTAKAILATIRRAYPDLEFVIAWNHPMVKQGTRYVFGLSLASEHILIAPFDAAVLGALGSRLDAYVVKKKSMQVPNDWKVDKELIVDMIGLTLA